MSTHHILLVLLLVGALLVFRWWTQGAYTREGFDLAETNKFHYQLFAQPPTATSKAGYHVIPVNPGTVDFAALDRAVMPATGWGSRNKEAQISKFFYEANFDNTPLDLTCQQAVHPRNISNTGLTTGCGWWFVENPSIPSTGALGTEAGGPIFTDRVTNENPGGRWIWDMAEAGREEDVKRCKRIRNCEFLATETNVQCGFCPELGHAIPVNRSGQPKYPQRPDATCVTNTIVTDYTRCPAPVYVPRLQGIDYVYDQNGNVVQNADTAARMASESALGGVALEPICAPLEDGSLSKECRLSLAASAGLKDTGRLYKRINGQAVTSTDVDAIALDILDKKGGLTISNKLWTDGRLSVTDAATTYSRLVTFSTGAHMRIVKDAALWFVTGQEFDVCNYGDDEIPEGDYALQCRQREFRKVGCQPAGSAYPAGATSFAGMTVKALRTQFRDLYMRMTNASTVREQDEAVQSCLGIQQSRGEDTEWDETGEEPKCKEPGVEYWFFEYPAGAETPRTLLDTYISRKGFLPANASVAQTILSRVRQGYRGGYVARTYVNTGTVDQVLVVTANVAATGLTIQVNPEENSSTPTSLSTASTSVVLPARRRNQIRLQYVGPVRLAAAATAAAVPSVTVTGVPLERFTLHQRSWRPTVSLNVSEDDTGDFKDSNALLGVSSDKVGYSSSVTGAVGGVNRFDLTLAAQPMVFVGDTGLRFDVMQTITCMVYWSSLSDQTTLFRIDQGTEGASASYISLDLQKRVPTLTVVNGQTGMWSIQGNSQFTNAMANTWVHVAVVLHATPEMSRIYVNERDVTPTQKAPTKRGTINTATAFTRILLGSRGFTGGMAWFHIYNRHLSAPQIKRDRAFDDPAYAEEAEEAAGPTPTGLAPDVGYTMAAGRAYNGRPLKTIPRVPTARECGAFCNGNTDCAGFTYTGNNQQCKLFRSVDTELNVTNTVIGANTFSARMPGRADDPTWVAKQKQGRCADGYQEFNRSSRTGAYASCCRVDPKNPGAEDYTVCPISPIGSNLSINECSMNPGAKFVPVCSTAHVYPRAGCPTAAPCPSAS